MITRCPDCRRPVPADATVCPEPTCCRSLRQPDKFTIYNASTGQVVVTNLTEQQAENVAGALRVYGQVNVSVASPTDNKGDNVHTNRVRLDEI